MAPTCPKYTKLVGEVSAALAKLTQLTQAQLAAFHADNRAEFTRLDKELENAVGHKERTIGALREHESEHRCHD